MKGRLSLTFFLVLFLLSVSTGGAWAASISGTVANSSGKTGRIYLSVQWSGGGDTGYGVSIAAPGPFQINGVQPGDYVVKALMDTQGTGIQHANDPRGTSSQVNVSSGDVSAGTITLNNPSPVAALAPDIMVFGGDGGNMVIWEGPEDGNGLTIADKYTVSWSTSSTGPATGSMDVVAGYNDLFAHGGGSSALYYQLTAVGNGTPASSPWTPVPPTSGSGSVSGRVLFPAITPTGPLYVALVDFSIEPPKLSVAAVTSPVSGGTYTVGNVPAGTYQIYSFLDMNNSGAYDVGDIGWLDDDDFAPMVTVSASPVNAPDVTLAGTNAHTAVTTEHGKNDSYDWYNLNLNVAPMLKQPVNVRITSGPQISTPVDVALSSWGSEFQTWFNVGRPTVGDTYQANVTYSDGTSETVSAAVTAVLDGFATPLAPVGYIPYEPTPTFSWTAPSPAPAEYIYSIWLNENNSYGNSLWDVWGLPSTQTSIVYGSQGDVSQPTLTDGITYNWNLTVKDRNGNRAQNQRTFTPTSAPVVSGFSPAGGLSGTTVTIDGLNFDPTPANNTVKFNNTPAAVTGVTPTTLTVTVPSGATTGPITVTAGGKTGTSSVYFVVAPAISFTGMLKYGDGTTPVPGALVELEGNASVKTTSSAGGSFTLSGLPWNSAVRLKITKSGYLPVYTDTFYLYENLDVTANPYTLFTAAELGLSSGQSAIFAKLLDSRDFVTTISGATATANPYTVSYYDAATDSFIGTATDASGLVGVFGISPNNWVNITASKAGWTFEQKSFSVPGGAVVELAIMGTPPSPPQISGFSPSNGKVGDMVTITGYNFSSNPLDNVVKFNGTTAQVSGGNTNYLWVYVPAGATTGPITVTTPGGSFTSLSNFTVQYTLSATLAGTGGGSVNSVPSGIACTGGTCSAQFDYNTSVTLTAAPDSGSTFTGWSGACSGTGSCTPVLNGDKSVTATFTVASMVKVNGISYAAPQAAYNAAAAGDVIQARGVDFTENLNLNRNISVFLKGGYDSAFSANSGLTVLQGILTIGTGALTVDNLAIK